MDIPTRLELEKLVEHLRERLPTDEFEIAAGLISEAVMLVERGVEGERHVIRAERELLEQQQRAVEAERRMLVEERKEIELTRTAADRQREAATAQEAAVQEIRKLASALQSRE